MTTLLLLLGIVTVLMVLALQVYALRKIRHIDRNTWNLASSSNPALDNMFRQCESLLAIHTDLQLAHSLPSTRGWAGSPDFLMSLMRELQTARPQTVVECSSGVSTIVCARSLQLNGCGHVFSLEHDAKFAELTRKELARHGLTEWATVIDAPLVPHATALGEKLWYDTRRLPDQAIDMLVIDGPPSTTGALARYPAGQALFDKLTPGASVFLDDADRPDERAAVEQWMRQFGDLASEQIPCEKGLTVLRKPLS